MASTYTVKKPVAWCSIIILVTLIVLVIVLPITAKRKEEVLIRAYSSYIRHFDDFSPENDPFAWTSSDQPETRDDFFEDAKAALARHDDDGVQMRGQINVFAWNLTGLIYGGFTFDDYPIIAQNGSVGAFLNIDDPELVAEYQNFALNSPESTQAPLLIGVDVIHGYASVYPINLGMAAAFDPDMIERGARFSAIEARRVGINWNFNPMLDISRDPRWGRVSEGGGEDAYLTGVLGYAAIKGYQAENMVACVKHVGMYGVTRAGRDASSGQMGRNVLFNQYFESYRRAFKAKPGSVMASFNGIGGVPTHHDRWMLTDVLRGHWGFDGFVVADWGGVGTGYLMRTVEYDDQTEAAYRGIFAGLDMNMSDMTYWWGLNNSADLETAPDGRTYREHMERSVKRILAVKQRFGWEDLARIGEGPVPDEEFMVDTQLAAEKSAVLLKNGMFEEEPALPLKAPEEGDDNMLLLVGQISTDQRSHQGSWALNAANYVEHVETIFDTANTIYGALGEDNSMWAYEPGYDTTWDKTDASWENVVKAVERFDELRPKTVVFVVGEHEGLSGEFTSRTNLTMSGHQLDVVQQIHALNSREDHVPKSKLILVVMAGRPLDISWESENLDAILYTWNSGSRGGPATWRLLHGEVSPSGKTPMTFPRNVGQIPIYYQKSGTRGPLGRADWDRDWSEHGWCMSVTYAKDEDNNDTEEIIDYQGGRCYSAMYLDSPVSPLYWFGHGLTYSDFTYSNPSLSRSQISLTELEEDYDSELNVEVNFTVNRVGDQSIDVTEIVQVYIRDVRASVAPTWKNLRGFARVDFTAGGENSREANVILNLKEDFGFYNEDMDWVVEAGRFEIIVAKDAYDEEHVMNFFVVDI